MIVAAGFDAVLAVGASVTFIVCRRIRDRRGRLMLATVVDWAALGKVVICSFAGAIVFTTGVLLEASPVSRGAGIEAFAVCAALGLYVMLTSK